jgi:hypothetical protein
MTENNQPPPAGWTLSTLQKYLDVRIDALQERFDVTQTAYDRALEKAEIALNFRLASMNEFREVLNDVSKMQVPRSEYNSNHKALIDRVEILMERVSSTENLLKGKNEGIAGTGQFILIVIAVLASFTNLFLFLTHK